MKIRIVIVSVLIAILTLTSSVFAVNQDFNFYLTSGGASQHSALTQKSGGSAYENSWYVTPKSSLNGVYSNMVQGAETVRFRCRDAAGNSVSNLQSVQYYGSYNYAYTTTSVGGAYYYLYADKPSSDPYSALRLVGTWCP